MDVSGLGSQPISADNQVGTDVRQDVVFAELQAEVEKLSSPAADGPTDWAKVCRLATGILKETSKDLLVASYLAVGLIHTQRTDGVVVGLQLYLELVESHWEGLYPQKNHTRIRILEWWLAKAHAALQQTVDLSFSKEQVNKIQEFLNRLDQFLDSNLQGSPSLAPMIEHFEVLRADGQTLIDPVPPDVQASYDTSEKFTLVPTDQPDDIPLEATVSHSLSPIQEANAAFTDCLQKTTEAAFWLWQQDIANPHPYRLTRQTSWNTIYDLPMVTDGRTRIAPPPSHFAQMFVDLRTAGDAESLLIAAETRQPQYIFWVDLSFFVAEALLRLGSQYEKAREAVCQETAFLIYRLPGLETFCFSDGTPFAGTETRHWLKGIAFNSFTSDIMPLTPSEAVAETEATALMENNMAEVDQLVGAGKLIEALEVIQQKLRGTFSRRDNLLWRLSLSRMLVDIGESRLALPHLEQVLDDITRHGLELYDPSLALRGLKLAWTAFGIQPEQKFKDQAQNVLHQIGRLDMAEMVRLTKN